MFLKIIGGFCASIASGSLTYWTITTLFGSESSDIATCFALITAVGAAVGIQPLFNRIAAISTEGDAA